MRILFVDDVPDTGAIFSTAFKIAGHETQLAASGQAAITAVENTVFDAIVMDVGMSPMDGLEATQKIRHLPNGRTVPIIVFTAAKDEDQSAEALRVGANAVLYKPILPYELLTRIEELVEGRDKK